MVGLIKKELHLSIFRDTSASFSVESLVSVVELNAAITYRMRLMTSSLV